MCSRPMYVICLLGVLGAMGASTARAELVGWWRFDETSGTTAADSSGKGNNGTVQGTAAWAAGKIGGAWQGNGTNAYIQIPHSDSLNISGAVTVAVWLNTGGGTYQVLEKGGTDGNAWKFSYGFRMESNRQMRAQWDNAGFYSLTAVDAGTWTHVAITFDPAGGANNWKWYVNGAVTNQMTWAGPLRTNTNNIVIGRDNYGGGRWYFTGMMDDLRIYNEALSADRIAVIMAGGGGPNRGAATVPAPADKATDVPRDTILSWKPGQFPGTHNVYLGAKLADVNTASAAVLVSQAQDANTYEPPAVLAYGQTYYWRIDEVNASTDHTVYEGTVWSFTVEPTTYPLKNITVSASSAGPNQGPEKTLDNADADLHGTTDTTMWLTDGSQPAWIQYTFDDVYKLQEMWVWNSNQLLESTFGLGAKDVLVEYSIDGLTWTTLAGVPPFAKAPGAPGYAHNTTVAFNGAVAKYVKLTINSNWGGAVPQTGLSEVRFFYKPVQAREPQPMAGATGVAPDLTLTWRPGHEVAAHNIYFGTDPNALTLAGTTAESRFTPAAVNLGTTYYWRVDEVNAAETSNLWTGKIWSFATSEYQPIDDFESYTDDIGDEIFLTWLDNYDPQAAIQYGAQVGNDRAPWAERTIIHGGKQSMPLRYNNTGPRYIVSEATRTWSTAQDWTRNGANTLSLYFRGNPTGFLQLAPDHFLMNGMGADIYSTSDQGRFVYKQLNGDGTIIARVDRLDATDPWAKAGVMIRQGVEANSMWAFALFAPGNGFRFQARTTAGGGGSSDTGVATDAQMAVRAPVWVKLERVGNEFRASYATVDAPTTWIPSPWSPQTIPMSSIVYVGLGVTSHVATVPTQAEFSSISVTGNVTGDWQSVDLGITQPAGNTPDPFYVTVKDGNGKSITLKHPDPLAVLAGTWQQWKIPFTDLADVNPAKIKTLILGIGDQTAPQRGVGTMYLDDIAAGRLTP
jgi:hypothetical protein